MLDNTKQLNIIIDTDPGTDDTIALAFAATFFKENISALISSYGNVDGEQTYSNLNKLAQILNIDCLVLKGSMYPLDNKNISFTDYHGQNGLCEIELPLLYKKSNKIIVNNRSEIDKLYKIIKSKKHVTYICIAPLTNFVKLIKSHSDSIKYIDELIIMGGGFNYYNVNHHAEYNFSLDGEAIQEVLNLPLKITICPLDMTQKYAFSEKEIENIVGCNRNSVFKDYSQFGIISQIFFKNYDTAILHKLTGAIIHDVTTLLYLLEPDKCDTIITKIKSDDFGAVTNCSDGEAVKIVQNIDQVFFISILKKMFKKLER